ncbi:nodulin-related protein 1-like [Lycium ferocissimum]|uniref:nodulin-related protein 1-like n=1 Tax=Lycium ferocissimum TaxID=112874 RepID=UPI002814D4F0|nr:nodulin-related protein 1-like [Lycium ferocissimum]
MDPTHTKTNSGASKPNSHPKPTKSELMSSAKLVADAAKAKLHHDQKKVEKAELAGAAADLLNAASQYGKLEDKSMGKFVGKAETYLHKYETSHSTTTTTNTATGTTTTTTTSTTEHTQSSGHTGGKHEQSGSGYGEYIKMAEGIFKKHSDGTHSSESGNDHGHGGGKKGEYLKMAGEFLKKH